MRSFRELFVQQCALAIFTAANEHEEGERERKVLQKVDRERGRRKEKKKSRMEIRLVRRSDEDNKSNHPGVSEPSRFTRPRLIAPSPSLNPRDKRLKEIQNSRKSRSHGKAFVASGLICLIFCVEERPS